MKHDLWPHISDAAAALAQGPPADLLPLISRVEDAQQTSSLEARVHARTPPLRLLPCDDSLAQVFAEITRAWVEDMFTLEANDKAIIEDPRGMIIDRGGEILFVETQGLGIVGTCALMPIGGMSFELTKMGVTASARGKKAGAFLLQAVLARAAKMRAEGKLGDLFLLTNAKCEAAIHLYEQHGFVHDPAVLERFGPRDKRCDVAMSYPVSDG